MSPTVAPSPTSSLPKSKESHPPPPRITSSSHAIGKKKRKKDPPPPQTKPMKRWTKTSSISMSVTETKISSPLHSTQTRETTTTSFKNPLVKSSSDGNTLPLSSPILAASSSAISATSTATVNVNKKKKKKNKKHSPFRIKAGCIVALRYRSEGNTICAISSCGTKKKVASEVERSYVEVWADPQPERDEGLALVGKRVRCCFPKSVLQQQPKKDSNEEDKTEGADKALTTTRIIEGEIICLMDYPAEWEKRKTMKQQRKQQLSQRVELLVDEGALQTMPFLQRSDGDRYIAASLSEKEKKLKKFEDIIRGKHKVSVQVNLADISGVVDETIDGDANHKGDLVARWVIRKRVPIPLCISCTRITTNGNVGNKFIDKTIKSDNAVSGDTTKNTKSQTIANGLGMKQNTSISPPSTEKIPPSKKRKNTKKDATTNTKRYVGDGNDSSAQQERNWRWLAGRRHELIGREGAHVGGKINNESFLMALSDGFIGEVLKVAASTSTSTNHDRSLATVTLRRLILPEHTLGGRMSHHGAYEIFEDYDSLESDETHTNGTYYDGTINENGDKNGKATPTSGGNRFWTIQIPVEELVIVSRTFDRLPSSGNDGSNDTITQPIIQKAYSACEDIFLPLRNEQKDGVTSIDGGAPMPKMHGKPTDFCHRCRNARLVSKLKSCSSDTCLQCQAESYAKKFWCKDCRQLLKQTRSAGVNSLRPRCDGCDCYICANPVKARIQMSMGHSLRKGQKAIITETQDYDDLLGLAKNIVANARKVHFNLPSNFVNISALPEASSKPITLQKKRQYKKRNTSGAGDPKNGKKSEGPEKKKRKKRSQNPNKSPKPSQKISTIPDGPPLEDEEDQIFKPTCSRTYAYDRDNKQFSGAPQQLITSPDSELQKRATQRSDAIRGSGRHNVRLQTEEAAKTVKKASSGRAARANQRRLMKDVAAIGATSLGLDALAGREQQLRFDKSVIHAWGVFADEQISAGDMIVEYRGELIGNAVTEKREKIYEKAKIGSDYMFRIDGETVCDATKQGNVARFINASCDPNCYTQIVTINGVKRIVIYAKKDIQAGQELCYDYKFPFEYDESKRIKCYCGAKGCRGFMNWDKKYVVQKSPEKKGDKLISKNSVPGKDSALSVSKATDSPPVGKRVE